MRSVIENHFINENPPARLETFHWRPEFDDKYPVSGEEKTGSHFLQDADILEIVEFASRSARPEAMVDLIDPEAL